MLFILIAILIAENICLAAYIYFRPDRAIRRAERAEHEFLCAASLKILNRGWGVQGAPAMDSEFDEPETPEKQELSEQDINELGPEDARRVLEEMEDDLAGAARKRSPGSIARRRDLVGKAELLRRRIAQGIPPKVSPRGYTEEPFVGTLEPEQAEHLESLRQN